MIPDYGDAHRMVNWNRWIVFFEAAAKAYNDPEMKWAASAIANNYMDFNTTKSVGLGYMMLDCYRYGSDDIEPQVPKDIPAVESRVITGAATTEPAEDLNIVPKVQSVPKPSLDKRGLPIAWVVQVGSFSKAKNARALKSRLIKQGYKAYTETATTDAGQTIRVFVGPMVSKQQSIVEKNKIDKAFNLKAKVIRYVP